MARLDDIPKKTIFRVPEGYFENLPSKIQSRLAADEAGHTSPRFPGWRPALRYAVPVVLVLLFFFFNREAPLDPESLLAGVESAELVSYLQDEGLTTDELLEQINFSAEVLDGIENEIYTAEGDAAEEEWIEDLYLNDNDND